MTVFSIPPHQPFLATLCRQLLDGNLVPGFDFNDPMVLANTRIYLPTERARRALGKELATQLGGVALLPQIRTFGTIDEVESQLLGQGVGQEIGQEIELGTSDIKPAISPLRRQLVLAQLIHKWISAHASQQDGFAAPPNLSDAANLAASLAELMDRFETEQVSMNGLIDLVPDDYQKNWQMVLQFLDIIRTQWPAFLAEQDLINPADHRNQLMADDARFLASNAFDGPVIAAGSTGSIPATARLLKAIAAKPNGAVILPGFDAGLSEADWAAILDEKNPEASHPQFGLGLLLDQLEVQPRDVIPLGAGPQTHLQNIVSIAFSPASQTDRWAAQAGNIAEDDRATALKNLTIVEAANEEEEARTIALIMRQAIQSDQRVALVTPQRTLARRVSNELRRWNIHVDDTAGSPLREASATRYLRLLIETCARQFEPVSLLAFLRNRLTCLGLARGQVVQATLLLEQKILRGPNPPRGLAGLRQAVETYRSDNSDRSDTAKSSAEMLDLLTALQSVFAPLTNVEDGQNTLAGWTRLLIDTLEAATRTSDSANTSPWNALLEGAPELTSFLHTLAAESPTGLALDMSDLRPLLESLLGSRAVHQITPAHPNLFIWGPLEARLQHLDRVILSGLSETVWPQAVDTGPWLSRHMQAQLGLALPERFIGLAAHDIQMALGIADRGGEVFLTRAHTVDGTPKTTSRWLQRLTTFIGTNQTKTLTNRGKIWLGHSAALDAVEETCPAPRPAPSPSVDQRPRGLSVTDAEILFRDPYAFYAKHTLRLRPLEPIGGEPDYRERGQIIHAILERFVGEGHLDRLAPQSEEAKKILSDLATQELAQLAAFPSLQALWLKRFEPIATAYLSWETARADQIEERFAEVSGAIKFVVAGEPIELRGRADRLDQHKDGQIDIIDFKTGSPPSAKDVRDLWSPQLPLEGLLLARGGFAELPASADVSFNYIKISHGPNPFNVTEIGLGEGGSAALIERAYQQLAKQIEALLLRDDLPFVSRVAPRANQNFKGDYDHLARVDEWSQSPDMSGEEDL